MGPGSAAHHAARAARCAASGARKQVSAFPRRVAPELCLNDPPKEGVALPQGGSGECRVPVAPAASCAKCSKAHELVTTVAPGSPGIPARDGFNGCFALSPVTGLVCHRHRRDAKHHRQLDASVGASGPHDFTVRAQRHSSFDMPRPSHPSPTSVTIAKRPFVWAGMARDVQVIWVKSEPKYFCKGGWTGVSLICPSGQNQRL
jgi:hypothetical protein